MKRHVQIALILAALSASGGGCGHEQRAAQVTVASIQAAVEATNATRDLAVRMADDEQKRLVDETEATVAALPPGPERAAKVEEWKASARAQMTAIRTRRDDTLRRTAKAYDLMTRAALILPLLESRPELGPEVAKLITEAYSTVIGAAP